MLFSKTLYALRAMLSFLLLATRILYAPDKSGWARRKNVFICMLFSKTLYALWAMLSFLLLATGILYAPDKSGWAPG